MIAKHKFYRVTAIYITINLLGQILYPSMVWALTGGPSQPEVSSFSSVSTSEMVDPFTGDFSYNIPLMDVGGYPINISYSSGITMDQEASWVGLGWNLNVGAINRNVRGIPDDFNGEETIDKEFNMKPNNTYGARTSATFELFGIKALGITLGITQNYNNYNGFGFDMSANPSFSAGDKTKGKMTVGLGFSASSESGLGITPTLSFSKKMGDTETRTDRVGSGKLSLPFNTRQGLQALSLSASVQDASKVQKVSNAKVTGGANGQNGGSSISFANPTYTPSVQMPLNSISLDFNASVGAEFLGVNPHLGLGGYYSSQYLKTRFQSTPAYGYMYSEKSKERSNGSVILDFNREKDSGFSRNKPNLPIPNYTYDVYSVSGQGVGGTYRLHRGDLGVIYDASTSTDGNSVDLPAVEIGAGNAAHIGTNFKVINTLTTSGNWVNDNPSASRLNFKGKDDVSNPLYEQVYFKQAGEKTVESDPEFFNKMGGFEPVSFELNSGFSSSSTGNFKLGVDANKIEKITSSNFRNQRQRRNQTIGVLNAEEANNVALNKQFSEYPLNDFRMKNQKYVGTKRNRAIHPKHHISEMTVYRPDGTRYIYGVPAYNYKKEEVTFAINNSADCATGLVSYAPGTDDNISNNNGRDHYFNKLVTPEYAHAYMLSAVVSADYVDLTGDGPTDDDLGTYTKFNYSKIGTKDNPYRWRVPFEENKANYNEGFKSDPEDDKGSYIYGEKEIWYIHSIETKTHVAEFYLADRQDAKEVASKNGGAGSKSMKKLMKISLYSKPDRQAELQGNSNHKATPIKEVHFEYDYSLCPGIPNNSKGQDKNFDGTNTNFNNQGGKLTLKKVYFTYGRSKKGRLSSYKFTYADPDHDGTINPQYNSAYNLKGYDRWGNFKPNVTSSSCSPSSTITTAEFPYTDQTVDADIYAANWSLSGIKLPSGGSIYVDYESDDYGYVQDKRAMQMFKITNISSNPEDSPIGGNTLSVDGKNNKYVFFELNEPITTDDPNPEDTFKKRYIDDLLANGSLKKPVYFKALSNLEGKLKPSKYEYSSGYVDIENAGLAPLQNGEFTHGFIVLKDQDGYNPIAYANWNYTKLYRPRIAFDRPDENEDVPVVQILESIISAMASFRSLIQNFYSQQDTDGKGEEIVNGKSWIRLYSPKKYKKGGGVRVKKLVLNDNWSGLTGISAYKNAQYGQEYDYTTKDEYGNVISSGVASYEPMLGGDENPFKLPITYSEDKKLAPSDDYVIDAPMGESFFPGASVGYSKVTVKNLQYANVKRNATGKTIHEFYTSKDFPTLVKETPIEKKDYAPNPVFKLLKIDNREFMNVSQGYVIELNDMHGKPKAQWVYQEYPDNYNGEKVPVSGVTYEYQTDSKGRLDNSVTVLNKNVNSDGKYINRAMAGVEYDFVADMREQESLTVSGGLGGNLDAFFAFLGVTIPTGFPNYSREHTRFRSAVSTKVINRYGILEKTTAYDLGSKVSTINKLYDAETGEVLLTETINQFDDHVYSFNYPAHLAYEGMEAAYKNYGVEFNNVSLKDIPDADKYFVQGDEVMLTIKSDNSVKRAWVRGVSSLGISLVDKDDISYDRDGIYDIKVIRSGHRNQHNTSIGSVVTLDNPINLQEGKLEFKNILNAGSIVFKDRWKVFCECGFDPTEEGFNPYLRGTRGNWRAERSYVYLTDRTQNLENDNVNVRQDGVFLVFNPFWLPQPTSEWRTDYTNWTFTSKVTEYSPYGFELENKDALNRYSGAVYGFNNTLPVAVANNSRYKETAFDSFEDYGFGNCVQEHFSFKEFKKENWTEEEAHSGRNSLKVSAGESVEMRKTMVPCDED